MSPSATWASSATSVAWTWSSWAAAPPTCPPSSLAWAPARVGVDLTPAQLATAARCQQRFGVVFPLVEAMEWPGGGVEFHPTHSQWIRVLGANGFVIDALHELYAPADAPTHEYYAIATAQWARQWPVEDLWAAHLPKS